VFPVEPKGNGDAFESPLRGDNVILTPHVGGSTLEAQDNIGVEVAPSWCATATTADLSAVNFPEVTLPEHEDSRRLLHIHRNVPGVLSRINEIFSRHNVNIDGQFLRTDPKLGYVVIDITASEAQAAELRAAMAAVPDCAPACCIDHRPNDVTPSRPRTAGGDLSGDRRRPIGRPPSDQSCERASQRCAMRRSDASEAGSAAMSAASRHARSSDSSPTEGLAAGGAHHAWRTSWCQCPGTSLRPGIQWRSSRRWPRLRRSNRAARIPPPPRAGLPAPGRGRHRHGRPTAASVPACGDGSAARAGRRR
jgi:hypothetical protein